MYLYVICIYNVYYMYIFFSFCSCWQKYIRCQWSRFSYADVWTVCHDVSRKDQQVVKMALMQCYRSLMMTLVSESVTFYVKTSKFWNRQKMSNRLDQIVIVCFQIRRYHRKVIGKSDNWIHCYLTLTSFNHVQVKIGFFYLFFNACDWVFFVELNINTFSFGANLLTKCYFLFRMNSLFAHSKLTPI